MSEVSSPVPGHPNMTEITYVCDLCGRPFEFPEGLKAHMNVNHHYADICKFLSELVTGTGAITVEMLREANRLLEAMAEN